MLAVLLAPAAMGLCFFVLWLAFRLRWSRMTVTMVCAVIMGVFATIYFAYPSNQAVCPLGGMVFGAVFGAAIGWTAFGVGSAAIRQRQARDDLMPPSEASEEEYDGD